MAATLLTLDTLEQLGKEHRVHVVFNNTTNEFPETVEYAHRMFKWLPENYPNLEIRTVETFPKTSFAKMGEKMFYVAVDMHEKGKWNKSKLTCCDVIKLDPLRRFFRWHTINLLVSGLRGDESRQRFLALFRHSPVHKGLHKSVQATRARKVTPLWDWSIENIKDYLEKHEKRPPVNPLYQRGAESIGCMLCPMPFIFIRDEIKAWYPVKVYKKGMELLVRGAEMTGRPFLDTYIGKEVSLQG